MVMIIDSVKYVGLHGKPDGISSENEPENIICN